MRRMRWMTLVGILFLVPYWGCGGGGGGGGNGEAQTALDNSIDAFGNLLTSDELEPCLEGTQTTCDCPGGGTFTMVANITTMDNCKTGEGDNFNGTITMNGLVLDCDMPIYGECSDVVCDDIPLMGCGGTISGTCADETENCTIVDNPDDPDECDVNC